MTTTTVDSPPAVGNSMVDPLDQMKKDCMTIATKLQQDEKKIQVEFELRKSALALAEAHSDVKNKEEAMKQVNFANERIESISLELIQSFHQYARLTNAIHFNELNRVRMTNNNNNTKDLESPSSLPPMFPASTSTSQSQSPSPSTNTNNESRRGSMHASVASSTTSFSNNPPDAPPPTRRGSFSTLEIAAGMNSNNSNNPGNGDSSGHAMNNTEVSNKLAEMYAEEKRIQEDEFRQREVELLSEIESKSKRIELLEEKVKDLLGATTVAAGAGTTTAATTSTMNALMEVNEELEKKLVDAQRQLRRKRSDRSVNTDVNAVNEALSKLEEAAGISSVTEENIDIPTRLIAITTRLQSLDANNQKLQKTVASVREWKKSIEQQLTLTEKSLLDAHRRAADSEKLVAKYKQESEESRTSQDRLVEELKNDLNELESQLSEKKAELITLKEEMDTKFSEKDTMIRDLKSELEETTWNFDRLKTEYETLESTHGDMDREFDECKMELKRVNDDMQELEKQKEALETEFTKLEKNVALMIQSAREQVRNESHENLLLQQKDNEELRNQVRGKEMIEKEYREFQSRQELLLQELKEAQEAKSELVASNQAVKAKFEKFLKAHEQMKQLVTFLETKMKEEGAKRVELESQLTDLKEENEALVRKNLDLNTIVAGER